MKMFWRIVVIHSDFKVDGEICVEGVHPGSDRISHSAARNQVPRHKLDF